MTSLPPANNLKTSNDMTLKLKELLDKRKKARETSDNTTAPIGVQLDSNADTASLIIPEWVIDDEFSKYF